MRALCSLIAATMLCAVFLPAQAQEMGRVFFTPEQRNALDARRRARIPDKAAATTIESPLTSVDGYVSRGSGKSTVWINGEAMSEGSQPEGVRVFPRRNDASRVTVGIGEAELQVDLKVGQSFDRATGEVRDPLQGGEVNVSRPVTRKPR